jgi:hypothetical protein
MKTPWFMLKLSLLFISLWAYPRIAHAYYDPGLQRWINRDPIQEIGGANLHAFTRNDPLSRVDYHGLFLGFRYGNWCGYSNQGQGGAPIDDLDTLCMAHDFCLATWRDACRHWKLCNLTFCSSVAGVDCSESRDPGACQSARTRILALCVVLSGTYTYP